MMSIVMSGIDQLRQRLAISDEKFAHRAGVSVSTYSRQKHLKQPLGGETLRAYARIAKEENDIELLRLMAAYAIDLDPEQIEVKI